MSVSVGLKTTVPRGRGSSASRRLRTPDCSTMSSRAAPARRPTPRTLDQPPRSCEPLPQVNLSRSGSPCFPPSRLVSRHAHTVLVLFPGEAQYDLPLSRHLRTAAHTKDFADVLLRQFRCPGLSAHEPWTGSRPELRQEQGGLCEAGAPERVACTAQPPVQAQSSGRADGG